MLKNKKFMTPAIWRIAAIVNFRKSMEFNLIKFCGKVVTVKRIYNQDRVWIYSSGN